MESFGQRIGFALLALPLFLLVNWLGWDERIAYAGIGALAACAISGSEEDQESTDSPIRLYLAFAIGSLVVSPLTALWVQHLAGGQIGLYDLATINSDWKTVRALPMFPVALLGFSLTMFALALSSNLEQRIKSDT